MGYASWGGTPGWVTHSFNCIAPAPRALRADHPLELPIKPPSDGRRSRVRLNVRVQLPVGGIKCDRALRGRRLTCRPGPPCRDQPPPPQVCRALPQPAQRPQYVRAQRDAGLPDHAVAISGLSIANEGLQPRPAVVGLLGPGFLKFGPPRAGPPPGGLEVPPVGGGSTA